jgi:hypothetical protein
MAEASMPESLSGGRLSSRDHYSLAATYAATALMAAAVTAWTAGTHTRTWADTAAIVLGLALTAYSILAALRHIRRGRTARSNGGPS